MRKSAEEFTWPVVESLLAWINLTSRLLHVRQDLCRDLAILPDSRMYARYATVTKIARIDDLLNEVGQARAAEGLA